MRRAEGGAHAARRHQILVRDRQPRQRPDAAPARELRIERAGGREGRLGQQRDDGIQHRIDPLEPVQMCACMTSSADTSRSRMHCASP